MATTAAIRIGPADHGRRIALQEFWDAEEEAGYRYELARGVLEVTNVPGESHGLIVCSFYGALERYRQAHPATIQRYGGAGEFRLWLPTMASGRNPDVAVVLKGTPADSRGSRPPSLVVEVVSAGAEAHARDYVTKREEYLAFGIHEYWIVDSIRRRILVLVRDGDSWVERTFGEGQVAGGLVLPDFAVPLDDLWAAAEATDLEPED
ncbi:Uma2 family endonuclease [Singulisphaera rosea]